MSLLVYVGVTLICVCGVSFGASILFRNAHHAALAAPQQPQIDYPKRQVAQVRSNRVSASPAPRRNYRYEEEEVINIAPKANRTPPPYRKESYSRKDARNYMVRRECSTLVLVFWGVTTLFCWFTLILQGIIEVIK